VLQVHSCPYLGFLMSTSAHKRKDPLIPTLSQTPHNLRLVFIPTSKSPYLPRNTRVPQRGASRSRRSRNRQPRRHDRRLRDLAAMLRWPLTVCPLSPPLFLFLFPSAFSIPTIPESHLTEPPCRSKSITPARAPRFLIPCLRR
jgi:hypothetical protein